MNNVSTDFARMTHTPTALPLATKKPEKIAPLVHTDDVKKLQGFLGFGNINDGELNPNDCILASCDVKK